MSNEPVIELRDVCKSYSLETRPLRRLWGQLSGRTDRGPQHHALQNINLNVRRGEVVGIVGRNGAGKSTLLQVVCGVLQPSSGQRVVRGRIAALLELGAGFNPELTGRENVRMNGPLLGLSAAAIEAEMGDIVDFAGIGEHIDQPVRTYSSGMFMRLAFSMATTVDPDILIIDEALSVGDGSFARKSFERIMALKDRGATILFCSHSTYHVESICSRALWLEQGRVRMLGDAGPVVKAYSDVLEGETNSQAQPPRSEGPVGQPPMQGADLPTAPPAGHADFRAGQGRLLAVNARAAGQSGKRLKVHSLAHDVALEVDFQVDPALPAPSVMMSIVSRSGVLVASAGTHNDGVVVRRDEQGRGHACLTMTRFPLLKGEYFINVFLACERGLHYYDHVLYAIELELTQDGLEQGILTLDHHWS